MKNEYKDIFDDIKPDEKLLNSVMLQDKKRVTFNCKKAVAIAAAFALIISCGYFGKGYITKPPVENNTSTSSPTLTEQADKDFTIIAYADETGAKPKELKDNDITLMDLKVKVIKATNDEQGNSVETYSTTNLGIAQDDDIESVDFKSEKGFFTYFDSNKLNDLVAKGDYYKYILNLTDSEVKKYETEVEPTGASRAANIKFVKEIMNSRDCSDVFTDGEPDFDKYAIYFSDEIDEFGSYCLLFIDKAMSYDLLMQKKAKEITIKTYNKGDVIDGITYFPDEVTSYLCDHPDTPFEELPNDNITITVHYKSGQSITKNILTSFTADGTLSMMYK